MAVSAYDQARITARRALGQLSAEQMRSINSALERFGQRVSELVRQSSGSPAGLTHLHQIVTREADLLSRTLERSIATGRDAAFKEITKIWEAAGVEYARARGLTGSDLAKIRTPPITLLGAWETMSPAGSWRTLLQHYTRFAADEVNSIVRNAFMEQVGPDELARRLRKYVQGSEPFQKSFTKVPTLSGEVPKVDLRAVPAALRGEAGQMVYNAQRIAFSEWHNARTEAEVAHMFNDPYIKAIRWTLSPNRGSGVTPDECDLLAKTDYYGLGPGVYPVDQVPAPPHPFDRCEMIPVTRPTSELNQPKPQPNLRLDPMSPGIRGTKSAKESAAQAIRMTQSNPVFQQVRDRQLSFPVVPEGSVASIVAPEIQLQAIEKRVKAEYGAEIFGTQYTNVPIANRLAGATSIEEGLAEMRAAGVKIPKGLSYTLASDMEAGVVGQTGHFGVRTSADALMGVQINAQEAQMASKNLLSANAEMQAKKGFWASSSPNVTMIHETGHVLHHQVMWQEFEGFQIQTQGWERAAKWFASEGVEGFGGLGGLSDREAMMNIARKVSRYATTTPLEFVAETFSGLVRGIKYDADVMRLYRSLRGPEAGSSVFTKAKAVVKGKTAAIRSLIAEGKTDEEILRTLKAGDFPQAVRSDISWVRSHPIGKATPLTKPLAPPTPKAPVPEVLSPPPVAEEALRDEKARAYLDKHYAGPGGAISSEELETFQKYENDGNLTLNRALRSGNFDKHIKEETGHRLSTQVALRSQLDALISKMPPTTKDVVVFRSVPNTNWILPGSGERWPTQEQRAALVQKVRDLVGKDLLDAGYVSTTASRVQAWRWGSLVEGDSTLIEIRVPKGSQGVWARKTDPTSQLNFKVKQEFLLPRDARFRVVSAEFSDEGVTASDRFRHKPGGRGLHPNLHIVLEYIP